jgi:hypothetical protein
VPNPHHYFDSFADELAAKFRRVGHLISHSGTTGHYHEEILRVALRNFLSRRFSVKTGFVQRSNGETSFQVDVLVVDENVVGAYLYQEGDFAIVSPAAVVAAIEAKTCLDASRFDEALTNIASVKRLFAAPEQMCGLVFGYEGTEPRIEVLDGWFKREAAKSLQETPELGPSLISFFKYGKILAKMAQPATYDDQSPEYHLAVNVASIASIDEQAGEGWQLRHMLALIQASCLSRDVRGHENLTATLDDIRALLMFSGGVPAVHQYFKFGAGYGDHRTESDPTAET